jgi:uncharacterized protein YdiU (UPF0061 family)
MKNTNAGWSLDKSYTHLPEVFYSRCAPERAPSPELVIFNDKLAVELGLNPYAFHGTDGAKVLSGNKLPEGAEPIAQAYAGHQFGHFTLLGDGRALLIGEQIAPDGRRLDIQLKGGGRTPYSRGGDGKAVLGPMLREYIISEAMSALGIPTTRSLAVVTTGEKVLREGYLPGAVLTRVASSHIRVGTLQYAAAYFSKEELKALADYTIKRHYPSLEREENKYVLLLREFTDRQASLIAKWQLAGFIHGVMNTDNVALSGETIDYGPCAFMDIYDPDTVFSSIDTHGRYMYGNQPVIAGWNLARFAETLLMLFHQDEEKAVELAQAEIDRYQDLYKKYWLSGMRKKLGIFNTEPGDEALIDELLSLMFKNHADYTNAFLSLTYNEDDYVNLSADKDYIHWHDDWLARLSRQDKTMEDSYRLMRDSNPSLIPRNYYVEEALSAANEGDYNVMFRLLEALAEPYAHLPQQAAYSVPPVMAGQKYKTFCGT